MHNPIKDLPKGLLASVKAMMEGTLDKGGKENKDIDNDGDYGSTDKYLHNRRKAISKAVKEEVEELEELSGTTLSNYRKKAKADPAFEKRKGKISHARKAIMAKRTKGIETATTKIRAKDRAEWEEHDGVEKAVKEHVRSNAHKVLAKHGFQKMADNDRHTTYAKGNDSTGHVETVTVKKPSEHDGKYSDISHFRSTNGWQGSGDRYSNDGTPSLSGGLLKKADIAAHKKAGMKAYEKHIKDNIDYHNERGLKEYVEVQDETIEESVQAYDSNNKLVGNYADMKTAQILKPGHKYVTQLTKGRGDKGKSMKANYGKLAKEEVTLTQEDLDFLYQLTSNEESIDEARGRPARAIVNQGFTIHPKTKEKLMHNNPDHMARIEKLIKNKVIPRPKIEASQHIMQQLQKAKVSMTGTGKVNFHDGSTHDVRGPHAAKLIDKYTSMKPHEKEAFQKKIQISHGNMMDELK